MAVQYKNVVKLSPNWQQLGRKFHTALKIDTDSLSLVQRYRALLLKSSLRSDNNGSPQKKGAQQCITEGQPHSISYLLKPGSSPGSKPGSNPDIYTPTAAFGTEINAQPLVQSVEPIKVLNAYYQQIGQINNLVDTCTDIDDQDRPKLTEALTKLTLKDMGQTLQRHWNKSTTEHVAQNHRIAQLQQQVSSLLANIPQVLWSVDVKTNRPLYVSPSVYNICPTDIQMPIPCMAWTDPEDQPQVHEAWETALNGKSVEVESRVRNANNEVRWFRRIFRPFLDDRGKVVRVDGIMEETTDTHSAMERLETLATIDTLTQLANRTLWHDRLSQAIHATKRTEDSRVVLMIVDLNHFKLINDTLGHPKGDDILRETAQRLSTTLREADTLARLGGDEFGIILPNSSAPWETATSVATKVLNCFETPFGSEEEELFISAAIGIAIYPDDGKDVSSLVSHAEIAMYRAKREDVGYHFFQPTMDAHHVEQLHLSSQLHHALENNELELHYQPKIDLAERCLHGVEALLRWRHPQRGLLSPDCFIPLAEQIGLITPITEWVINTALKQHRDWLSIGQKIPVAVNVSALSFQNPKLVEKIKNALRWSGVSPRSLEIEITENTLLTGLNHCSDTINELSKMGVRIAIDDFGTGYSSLSYLRQLPIDTLKIDKSFVQQMTTNHSDAVIVRSIIELGHNLGFEVVAEGVETYDACKTLQDLHCDTAQGFFIGTPMSEVELTNWLYEAPWVASWH